MHHGACRLRVQTMGTESEPSGDAHEKPRNTEESPGASAPLAVGSGPAGGAAMLGFGSGALSRLAVGVVAPVHIERVEGEGTELG